MAHRKRIKHFHTPGDLHEFTFSCYQRRPLLTDEDWREKLARSLNEACTEQQVDLVAFVFMPEHLHLLVYPRQPEPNLGLYLAMIKQPFSKQIKDVLLTTHSPLLMTLTVRERPGKTCFRFWQEGAGYDRNLNTRQAIQASIDYIHMNPVRPGCRLEVVIGPLLPARHAPATVPRSAPHSRPADWHVGLSRG